MLGLGSGLGTAYIATTRPVFTGYYARYLCACLGAALAAFRRVVYMYFRFLDDVIIAHNDQE